MVNSAADYIHAVVLMETKVTNYMGRTGDDKKVAVATSDSRRTGRHESLMAKVNIVNRLCVNHGVEPIYTCGSHRRQYGDFAFQLIAEIFIRRNWRKMVGVMPAIFVYRENHSLSEWFKRAYGDKQNPC